MKEESIIVLSDTDVLKARRVGREMVTALGYNEIAGGAIEIAISELATNLVKHRTINGRIIMKPVDDEGKVGLEITAVDEGPGIQELASAMRGGESTAGTLGIGLSAVKRLMDVFSIESRPDKGTTVVARKWLSDAAVPKMKFSVLSRPKPGEDVSGDAYFIKHGPGYALFSVIDALGHGVGAHETVNVALKILEENYMEPLITIIERCHKGLRHTRGAAIAVCRLDFTQRFLEHIGIGNVETRIYGGPEPSRPFCFNGTLGMAMERWRVIQYPYTEGSAIVMYSDGISGRFDLSPQECAKTPQDIASLIFDEYIRDYDDATVLVGR